MTPHEDFVDAFCEKCASLGLTESETAQLLHQWSEDAFLSDPDVREGYGAVLRAAAAEEEKAAFLQAAGVNTEAGLGGTIGGGLGLFLGRKFGPAGMAVSALAGAGAGFGAGQAGINAWNNRAPASYWQPSWMVGGSNPAEQLSNLDRSRSSMMADLQRIQQLEGSNHGGASGRFQRLQQQRELRRSLAKLETQRNQMVAGFEREHGRFLRSTAGTDSRLARLEADNRRSLSGYSDFLNRADDGSLSGWFRGRWADAVGAPQRGMDAAARVGTVEFERDRLRRARETPWNAPTPGARTPSTGGASGTGGNRAASATWAPSFS